MMLSDQDSWLIGRTVWKLSWLGFIPEMDKRIANVFVSVMGSEADAKRTMQGLQSARGMIQTRLAHQLDIRQCPILRFHLDVGIKVAIETFRQLQEVLGDKPANGGPTDPAAGEPAEEPAGDEPEPGAEA